MNIAIIGYGKMGNEIAHLARDNGHKIGLIIDINREEQMNEDTMKDIDVAIEFSSPDAALVNIKSSLKYGVPVVCGTTGWLDKWEEITSFCNEKDGAIFYASNYSIGVNILFALNKKLASIMNHFPEYGVGIQEVHHIHKLDAPSGTAISLANQISNELERKNGWSTIETPEDKILIECERKGEVNGYHSVTYDSEADTISLIHNAKSRKGFALGALMAAEFLIDKKGIYSMDDLLHF